jgi:hypothetical protein
MLSRFCIFYILFGPVTGNLRTTFMRRSRRLDLMLSNTLHGFSSIWCFSLRCLIKLLVLPPFPWQNVLHRLQLAPPCLLVKYAHTGERFDLLPTMFTLAIANTELARVENSHYHLNYLLRQLRCEFSFFNI